MVNKLNKEFYNTVLAQAFSPCGNFLITGDIYGNLSVFNLSKLVNPEGNVTKEELTPRHKITVKANIQINSLSATDNHLLVGVCGEIFAYLWTNVTGSNRNSQPTWSIEIPSSAYDDFNRPEVNSLLIDDNARHAYAGCGDNKIYFIDLERRKILKVLDKHTDYIHCLRKNENDTLISGGEDGLVNIWDTKSWTVVSQLEPHLNSKIGRNELGKWIGALDFNEDYIICGGGPRLALFHYRFLSNSMIFPIDDNGIHVAQIYEDKVLTGGRSSLFYQTNFNGAVVSEIPTSGPTTYSMVIQEDPFKIMCIAGSSPKIDVSLNFMYKDQQISLY